MSSDMFDMTSIVSLVILAAYQAGQHSMLESKIEDIKKELV